MKSCILIYFKLEIYCEDSDFRTFLSIRSLESTRDKLSSTQALLSYPPNFPPGDPVELASGIRRLFEDKRLYAKLKKNGQKTVLEDFSMERTIDNYKSFFSARLAAHKK